MAGDAKKLQPIIVKRIKKAEHAYHGGAWKIAYADFVTAMMAFFLLMWLLGSTTEGDRRGIQDYFNSPLRVSMAGGSGAGDATSIIKGGGSDLTKASGQVKRAANASKGSKPNDPNEMHRLQAAAEAERLRALKSKVEVMLANDARLKDFRSQIRLDMTRDGLRIQIVDHQQRPMFDSGSAVVKPYMRDLLRAIGGMLADVPNKLTLEGHTDAQAYSGGVRGYSNWELSADRANASRRELVAGGLHDEKVLRVQGLAASQPFDSNDPDAPVNRRISIIVMNRDAEERFFDKLPEVDAASNISSLAPDRR
ncbi:MAG: flagellar motor protein MotB [Proteobacteria bacterium]|nr:flagellar motor protein MotB [Pseudomonadota bacterium]